MQVGSTELILILLVLIIAYALSKAGPFSATGSAAYRARPQGDEGAERDDMRGPEPSRTAKDPYAVLEIAPNATQAEVAAAYRKMAQMYHPDKVAGLAPEYREIAERRMKEINAAYEQIKDRSATRR